MLCESGKFRHVLHEGGERRACSLSIALLLVGEGEDREWCLLCEMASRGLRARHVLFPYNTRAGCRYEAGWSQMEPVGQILGKGLLEGAAEGLPGRGGQRSRRNVVNSQLKS